MRSLFFLLFVILVSIAECTVKILFPVDGSRISSEKRLDVVFSYAENRKGGNNSPQEDLVALLFVDGKEIASGPVDKGIISIEEEEDRILRAASSHSFQIVIISNEGEIRSRIITVHTFPSTPFSAFQNDPDSVKDQLLSLANLHQVSKWGGEEGGEEGGASLIVHPPNNSIWSSTEGIRIVIKVVATSSSFSVPRDGQVVVFINGMRAAESKQMERISFALPSLAVGNYEILAILETKEGEEFGRDDMIQFSVVDNTTAVMETSISPSLVSLSSEANSAIATAMRRNDIPLVVVCNWKCTGGWEWSFISWILSKHVQFHVVEDPSLQTVADHVLLCVSENLEGHKDPADLLLTIRRMRETTNVRRLGILHLSDEWYSAPYDAYNSADYVIRNYWSEKTSLQFRHVVTLPLGCTSGYPFWTDVFDKSQSSDHFAKIVERERKYQWNFIGDINQKPWRKELLDLLQTNEFSINRGPSFLLETKAVGGGLPKGKYQEILFSSNFSLCPRGFNNMETFRMYEAIEAGSIPIAQDRRYFEMLLGEDHPIPVLDNWKEELGGFLDSIDVEKTRRNCIRWWNSKKRKVLQAVGDVLFREIK